MLRALILLSVFGLAVANLHFLPAAEDPTNADFAADRPDDVGAGISAAPSATGLRTRVWRSIGFLHPAIAHFPIVLFSFGSVFVLLAWKWPAFGVQIPLACMLGGAGLAIVAAVMGWSLAPEQGYGARWSFTDWDREINVHRMSGSIVASVSSVFAIVALAALWRDSDRLHVAWRAGLVACALMAGLVGHQGGELKYGEDFLPRMLRILAGHEEPQVGSPNAENAENAVKERG